MTDPDPIDVHVGRYDGDRTGTIDFAEMALLFADIGESLEAEEVKSLVTKVIEIELAGDC